MELSRAVRSRLALTVLATAQIVAASFGVLTALAPQAARATQSVPYKINFQGRLTDSSGNILSDGSYNIKFRLFDAVTSGANKWEEDHVYGATDKRITVTSGLFNVQFGDVTALTPALFNQATTGDLWLEVELPTPATATCATNGCASFTEGAMTPRQTLASAAYAFNADTLDGLDSTDLLQTTSNLDPAHLVQGSGAVTLQSGASTAVTITSNAAATWSTAGSSQLTLQSGSGTLSLGTTTALTTAGALTITSGGSSALSLDTSGSAALSLGATNATSIVVGGNTAATLALRVANSSAAAFALQTASGTKYLVADTSATTLKVGGGDTSVDTTPVLLVLDHKTDSGDPTGTGGASYYNESTNTFRCYQNGAWQDCLPNGHTLVFLPGYASATSAATNLASTTTNCIDDPSYRILTDLRGLTKVRLQGRLTAGNLATANKIRIQYNPSADPTISTGDTGWAELVTSAGSHTSGAWFYTAEGSIPGAAQINPVQLRLCAYDGDGAADPAISGAILTAYP